MPVLKVTGGLFSILASSSYLFGDTLLPLFGKSAVSRGGYSAEKYTSSFLETLARLSKLLDTFELIHCRFELVTPQSA